jgi:ribosomal protein S18 acetylase RimI-like enzyme
MTVNYQLRIVSRQDVADLHETCWPDIVATLNDKPVGYAQLTLWPRVSEISDLVVTESLRGHGIGTALICFLIDLARSWVMDNVEIGVAMSNHRAYTLYRRLGFQSGRIINLDLGLGSEPVMYLTMPLETKLKT